MVRLRTASLSSSISRSEIVFASASDVGDHRHNQAIIGIGRNANIRLLVNRPFFPIRIEPGVERRRRGTARGERPQQTHGHIGARLPVADIGVIDDRSRRYLRRGTGHVAGHRPSHTPQGFDAIPGGLPLRRLLNIGAGRHPAGAGRNDRCEINTQASCQRPHGRGCPHGWRWLSYGSFDRLRFFRNRRRFLRQVGKSSHERPAIDSLSLGKLNQHITYRDELPRLAGERLDRPTLGRRNLDDRLVRLDGDERLIDDDAVPRGDMPGDDLRLLDSLSEIRQSKCLHANSKISCAAARIVAVSGM